MYINALLSIFLMYSHAGATEKVPFINIVVGGDTMLANTPTKSIPSSNLIMPLAGVLKAADIAFVNYEGTLCDKPLISHKCANKPATQLCYAFRGPTRFAQFVAEAGIDIVSLANNHIFDYGHGCATDTKQALADAGVASIGLMSEALKQPNETIQFLEHKKKKILFLGFHYSDAWGRVISMNNEDTVRELIRTYRDQAQIIVVSFHAGGEGPNETRTPLAQENYSGENRGNSRRFARIAIDEGADLVVGHGPHVLRGLEMYKDRLIIYSLGNFATYDLFSMEPWFNIGAMIEVNLHEDGRLASGYIHSIKQDYIQPGNKRGGVFVSLDDKNTAIELIQKMSNLDFATPPKIYSDGRILP